MLIDVLSCDRHGKRLGWLLLAAHSQHSPCCALMHDRTWIRHKDQGVHSADSAGCFVQADLDEEQRATQREIQRAQNIGELALEQHQGLELALMSMAKIGTQFQSHQFVAKKQTEVMLVCNTPNPFAYSPSFHDCPAHVCASSQPPLMTPIPPLPKHTHQALSFWAYILLSLCAPFISGIQQGAPNITLWESLFNREVCDYTPAS